MRKRAIRLRHFMCIFAFLDRVALPGGSVLYFLGQRVRHRHSFTIVRVLDDPTHSERNLSRRRYFHRHLIRCPTDPARFYFQPRPNILDRLVYDFQRINRIRTFARLLNCCVNNPLRERFLAALHHSGDEPGHRRTPISGIDVLFLFVNSPSSRHSRSSYSNYFFSAAASFGAAFGAAALAAPPPAVAPPFGRFAPYLERPRRRPSTPSASSVPRTM